jgi:cytochrome c oxidase subunit 4
MAEEAHEHPHPNYMAVFYTLFALTVAEVGVTMLPYMQEHEGIMIAILLAMALTKAGMVALYFMHLKYDNIVLSIIAGVPLLLVAIAVSVLAYEYANYTPADPSGGAAAAASATPEAH